MEIDWNLLGRAPDYGALFRKGFAEGRDTSRQYRQENALAALASNPEDEGAMSELAGINPEAAWRVQDRRTAAARIEQERALELVKERERDIMEGAQIIRQINPQGPEDWNRVLGAAQARGINLEGVPRTWDEQTKTYAQQLVDLADTFEPQKDAASELQFLTPQDGGVYVGDKRTGRISPGIVPNPGDKAPGSPAEPTTGFTDEEVEQMLRPNGGQPQPAAGRFPRQQIGPYY